MTQQRRNTIWISLITIMVWLYYQCLPTPLFNTPYSTVLFDKDHHLLGAHVAEDEQWRFHAPDSIPYKFEKSLLLFEDEHFFKHPGINPLSLVRALKQNLKQRAVVSGASTITMQVIRLSNHRKRTLWSKIIEIIQATRLELQCSKEDILQLYTTHAPFGGNVVGLNTAAWRYFGRPAHQLSWSESALLAVLPNAPSLIHPGKNRSQLLRKRNRLLKKLLTKGFIKDTLDYELSLLEPVPQKPMALPNTAPHLLSRLIVANKNTPTKSTLSRHLQKKVAHIIQRNHAILEQNEIHNAAAIVLENKTGNVLAYLGNTRGNHKGNQVDIITSPRSTGSILKPFLYAASLSDGQILPKTLLADIPTFYSDFAPQNFHKKFDGAVPADQALSRSLNIPAVRLLDNYGIDRFHGFLSQAGLSTLTQPPGHYGLSLILGGAEATLWDLTGIYSSMARTLNHFTKHNSRYFINDFRPPNLISKTNTPLPAAEIFPHLLPASAIYQTFEAMTNLDRPHEESGWERFSSTSKIAWKTGTSFGYRDAWAIGVTPAYTVGVWVGNASGEGRPGITGGSKAGPILFQIFNLLPTTHWFETPYDDMAPITTCRESGHRAGQSCPNKDSIWVCKKGLNTSACPYHQIIHLTKDGHNRVSSDCFPTNQMKHISWFVLPPVQEWYYKNRHANYRPLPPIHPDCEEQSEPPLELLYPHANAKVFIPVDLDGQHQKLVFKAVHRDPSTSIFWHLDNNYIGTTHNIHHLEINPSKGHHQLTLMDQKGNTLIKNFTCL